MQVDDMQSSSVPPVSTINVGSSPSWITYDSGNGYVYVSNFGSSTVSVIHDKTVMQSVNVGTSPGLAAYDDSNGYIYVPNSGSDNVSVINGTTVIATLAVGGNPNSATYNSRNGFVYVVNTATNNVSVINGTILVGEVKVANGGPIYATCDAENGYIYVATWAANVEDVINGTTLVGAVNVGYSPYSATYDSENGYIYVSNSNTANVSVINGTKLIATVYLGGYPVLGDPEFGTFDARNGFVYVPNTGSHNVSIINGTKLVASVPVGSAPQWATFDGTNGDVYVPNSGSDNVTVISGMTNIGTITVGSKPPSATYDSRNGILYVPNSGSNTVSAIFTGYTVNFTETGLPSDTSWSVNLSGDQQTSTSPSMTFAEYDGSYSYTAGIVPGFSAVPASGTFMVTGSGLNETIQFTITHPVNFTETGLPTGTEWWVNVTGGPSARSNLPTLALNETDGAYAYTPATADKTYSAPGGAFRVNGAGVSQTVTFSRVTFPITFTAMGLPIGTNWSVTLDGLTQPTIGTIIGFVEPNGTYSYRLGAVPGWTTPKFSGSIAVNGTAISQTISWLRTTYRVAIAETGLPSGTEWWANVSGEILATSNETTLSFSVPNGTYSFLVATTDKTYASPGGSVVVNGSMTSGRVAFSRVTYLVTFLETGLPSGTSWSVTVNTHELSSRVPGNITFSGIANGSYPFTVGLVTGYKATPGGGSVSVSGPPSPETIRFQLASQGPGNQRGPPTILGLPLTEGYAIIAGITIAIIVMGVTVVTLLRKRGNPTPADRLEVEGPPPPAGPPAKL
jgi:YVTN family beta-propeller protein